MGEGFGVGLEAWGELECGTHRCGSTLGNSLSGQLGYLVLLEQRDRVGSRSGKAVVPAGRERDVERNRVGLRFSRGWRASRDWERGWLRT